MKPIAAVAAGLLAAVVLFLFIDLAVGIHVLPEPGEVEWVPAASRPYLQLDHGWYQLKPSFRGQDYWGSRIYDVVTDEHGFRVDDRRPIKPGPGRVIFLGDSFTYGVNGPSAETFVGMYDEASSVKVLNAGVRALYIFNDVHFTEAGNRLVFEQIAAVVPPR